MDPRLASHQVRATVLLPNMKDVVAQSSKRRPMTQRLANAVPRVLGHAYKTLMQR